MFTKHSTNISSNSFTRWNKNDSACFCYKQILLKLAFSNFFIILHFFYCSIKKGNGNISIWNYITEKKILWNYQNVSVKTMRTINTFRKIMHPHVLSFLSLSKNSIFVTFLLKIFAYKDILLDLHFFNKIKDSNRIKRFTLKFTPIYSHKKNWMNS